MKRIDKCKEIFRKGNNIYYYVEYDENVYLGTEILLDRKPINILGITIPRKPYTQEFKLIEVTPSMLTLFEHIVSSQVEKEDKEFPDMTTYKKPSSKEIRDEIKGTYLYAEKEEEKEMRADFEKFCVDYAAEKENMSSEDIKRALDNFKEGFEGMLEHKKLYSPLNKLVFDLPKGKEDNDVLKKMVNSGFEFLNIQKIGSTVKAAYVYDLDQFGTVTIYKMLLVKDHIKKIETFVFNREILDNFFVNFMNEISEISDEEE